MRRSCGSFHAYANARRIPSITRADGSLSTVRSSSSRTSARAVSTARKLTAFSDEAEAGADRGDDETGDRRADDARAVEEARVERDGVRQLARPDHLEGQRLAARRVERERDAAERGEHVDDRQGRRSGQRDDGERDGDRHGARLRRHDELARLDPVGDDSGSEPEDGEWDESPERERADRERRSGELDDEPRERDVLHPRPGERDDLAGEEDPVVAVPAETAERACAQREARACVTRRPHEPHERRKSGFDRLERFRIECAQAIGEPRRAAGADAPHQPLAIVREAQADAAPVLARAHPLDEPSALEPVDVARHRRGRDALLGGELGEREARAALHEPEERRLTRGYAELLRLLAQLAREAQEYGPEVRRNCLGRKRNLANH